MKIQFRPAIFVMALAAFVFTGCQENENTPGTGEHQEKGLLDWSAAANPNNPNDLEGLTHNRGLEHILTNVNYGNLNNVRDVYYFANDFYIQDHAGSLEDICTLAQFETLYDGLRDYETPPSLDYMLSIADLSVEGAQYASLLLADNYPETSLSYYDFKDKAVAWEAGISTLGLSGREEAKLYTLGSTLRYSALAWHTAEIPTDGNDYIELQGSDVALSISIRDVVIAVVDAVGTVILGPAVGSALSAIVSALWPA